MVVAAAAAAAERVVCYVHRFCGSCNNAWIVWQHCNGGVGVPCGVDAHKRAGKRLEHAMLLGGGFVESV